MISKISFIVKTFKRYECLGLLLESIARYYPDAEVIVADDNDKIDFKRGFYKRWKNIQLVRLPFDSGLSKGRNEAIKASTREYILLLDDDFIFTAKTDIEKFYKILQFDKTIGVVGGVCLENGREVHYEHKFLMDGKTLRHISDGDLYRNASGVKFKYTECVLNFGLFRREVFNDIQWDEDLKLAEHLDFYLRFKNTKWRVAFAPKVHIIHAKKREGDYKDWRSRGRMFSLMMFKKNKIQKMITLNGVVTEIRARQLFTYKTKV